VTIEGYGFMNGFVDHLYTQLRTTSNYGAIADLETLQFPTAPAKPFPAWCVLTSRSLAAASNSEDSSASRPQVLLSQPTVQNSVNSFNSRNSTNPAYNISARPHRKHRFHCYSTYAYPLPREPVCRAVA
jgi:hypothetical protein